MRNRANRVVWDMVDGPLPTGLLGVGSGDLLVDGERWVLLLGGYSTSFRNRLYAATAPLVPDPFTASWTVVADRRGRTLPLLPDPPRNAWDGGGLHTPSYLPAHGSTPARIYYAGRAGRRHTGTGSRYAIGVLEHRNGTWIRRDRPLLTGTPARPSVLEPRVVRAADHYVLWFLSTVHEVARGEQPDYRLMTSTSPDGISDWTPPQEFASTAEGFFDVALTARGDRWLMVLARGTNLHRTTPYPAQGLWAMSAPAPSPRRQDWTPPVRILDTDTAATPAWMGAGVCDPALAITPDGGLTVYATGTHRYPDYTRLLVRQLRHRRRVPLPAPFHLATVALRFDEHPDLRPSMVVPR